MEDYRNKTKKVQIGNVCIGGGAAGKARAAEATALPATSTATPPRRNTEHTNALRPLWPEGIFASQLTVVGGKDRDGAQQVVVGLLIGAVTDVQLVHHLFPPPPFHVAQL